jgi:hypothetical protein
MTATDFWKRSILLLSPPVSGWAGKKNSKLKAFLSSLQFHLPNNIKRGKPESCVTIYLNWQAGTYQYLYISVVNVLYNFSNVSSMCTVKYYSLGTGKRLAFFLQCIIPWPEDGNGAFPLAVQRREYAGRRRRMNRPWQCPLDPYTREDKS